MNRALLERPFEAAQIRQRRGRNGMLDYVEGWSVIQRLNEALDAAWSFEVTHHEIREDEVLVLGRLSAEGVTKMAFGTSQVTREKDSGQVISLGDDLKAAATDAMKKCSTFLGVGLHLYADKPLAGRGAARPGASNGARPDPAASRAPVSGESNVAARPAPAGQDTRAHRNGTGQAPPPAPAPPPPPPPSTPANGDAARATDRQLETIIRIGKAKGLAPADIDAMSLRTFRRKPGGLTRNEASSLIKELSNLKRQVA